MGRFTGRRCGMRVGMLVFVDRCVLVDMLGLVDRCVVMGMLVLVRMLVFV